MEKEEESEKLQLSIVLENQASSRRAFTFKKDKYPFSRFQEKEFLFFSLSKLCEREDGQLDFVLSGLRAALACEKAGTRFSFSSFSFITLRKKENGKKKERAVGEQKFKVEIKMKVEGIVCLLLPNYESNLSL